MLKRGIKCLKNIEKSKKMKKKPKILESQEIYRQTKLSILSVFFLLSKILPSILFKICTLMFSCYFFSSVRINYYGACYSFHNLAKTL